MSHYVLAITGASGAIYALRLLQLLLASGHVVHLVISRSGAQVLATELGLTVDLRDFQISQLFPEISPLTTESPATLSFYGGFRTLPTPLRLANLRYHRFDDFTAGIASGSFLTQGMVI
ncbi:MAG: 3-octaprenyl-4-hydroxybenzoate carboxy-lyase, partial [Planctomycetota bacterium]|nr:3-octaprenyl-4-hydroxybenzoate carboxy-lyase [Planctomycetota bacterium]